MITTATRLLYLAAGYPDFPTGPHSCTLCASLHQDGTPLDRVLSDTFTDHGMCRSPASRSACPACAHYFLHRWHANQKYPAEYRKRSLCVFAPPAPAAQGHEPTGIFRPTWHDWERASMRSDLESWLADGLPTDAVLVISLAKKKHLLPLAPVNPAGSRAFTVMLETQKVRVGNPAWRDLAAAFDAGWPPVLRPVVQGRLTRYLPKADQHDACNFVIPVKRWGHKENPDWFWHASWAFCPDGFALDRGHWVKRFDGADPMLTDRLDFGSRRGNVAVSSGRYKNYRMPLCLVVAARLEWHCLGAHDGVARLLARITHLGHKRGQGHGEVRRWEVTAARDDHSLERADGAPARALPASYFEDCRIPDGLDRARVAIRAPSWNPSRWRECAVPPAMVPVMS